MNNTITRQIILMQQAINFYEDIKAIERNFNRDNDVLVDHKCEILQELYAEKVTELAKLLMNESINCL